MNKISISQNQKSIMLCKIQFLERQLEEAGRREETLQHINQQLRNAIPELINDKSKVVELMINQTMADSQVHSAPGRSKQVESLKNKLRELGESNTEYQRELRRMESNMKEHIEAMEMAHERDIRHYVKKIECLEIKLSKNSNTAELEEQIEELRQENRQLRMRVGKHQGDTQSQLNISNLNTSQIELQSMIKTLNQNQRDTTFTLQDIENVSFNRIPTQTDCSSTKERGMMSRSRSGISATKGNVISSLYCEECQQNYPPNQYYRHLEVHEEKARLMEEKREIDRRLEQKGQRRKLEEELVKVSVALQHHPKRTCVSARNLIR